MSADICPQRDADVAALRDFMRAKASEPSSAATARLIAAGLARRNAAGYLVPTDDGWHAMGWRSRRDLLKAHADAVHARVDERDRERAEALARGGR